MQFFEKSWKKQGFIWYQNQTMTQRSFFSEYLVALEMKESTIHHE